MDNLSSELKRFEANIERYVNSLHEAYLGLRRRIHPDMTRVPGSNVEWSRLAQILMREKIDPYDYIRFCYDLFVPLHDDLYPAVVFSFSNVSRFKEAVPTGMDESLRTLVRLQLLELEHQLRRRKNLEAILVDENLPFSALFRFAIAKAFGFKELLPLFEEDAIRMLLFKPTYKVLLKDLLEGNHESRGESIAVPVRPVTSTPSQ
jgi:hypothetical protein